jgi:hypothetical protein
MGWIKVAQDRGVVAGPFGHGCNYIYGRKLYQSYTCIVLLIYVCFAGSISIALGLLWKLSRAEKRVG